MLMTRDSWPGFILSEQVTPHHTKSHQTTRLEELPSPEARSGC
jgi:hypothetical protein